MLRYLPILMICIFSNCSNTRIDCSKNHTYVILDSLLSSKKSKSSDRYFYNPDFTKRFIEKMCQNVGQFDAITYCEMESLFNEERRGVVFIHDKNKFFSFYQEERGSKLEFSEDKGKIESFYEIVTLLKNDFSKRGDSLKQVYENKELYDAPLLRITQVNDSPEKSKCQSFIFPYVPEH